MLIVVKSQWWAANHVDGISLMRWHYKDNGWEEIAKRTRYGAGMEKERH